MTSSTEESTVPEAQNETPLRTEVPAETIKGVCAHFSEYGRQRPGIVALWCLGIGFVLGWKLKPW